MNVKGHFFSQEEIENMHEMTLRVLEKDGVVFGK